MIFSIHQVLSLPPQKITTRGWIRNVRRLGSITFLILEDKSGSIQITTQAGETEFKKINQLTRESVVEVRGDLIINPIAPGGKEVIHPQIKVLSQAHTPLPLPLFSPNYHQVKQTHRLDHRWLDLRLPSKRLVFEIWTIMEQTFINYLISQSFILLHTPTLMQSPSESGAEVFEVKYFKRRAYLAQSAQFYKQMAIAAGFEKVFIIGPTFRAEKSFTRRHATEFVQYDLEVGFIHSHQEIIRLEEDLIVAVLESIKAGYSENIKNYYNIEITIPKRPFPQLTLKEAKNLLRRQGIISKEDNDLSPEEERSLGELVRKKFHHDFVFVTDWPVSARPFYHMRYSDKPNLTKSFDLLYKGLEITTGAQREHRYQILKNQAQQAGLNAKNLEYYFNFFKYGCPPHGGLGFGPARFLMQLLELPNIREVDFLHRGVNRLSP